MIGSSFDSDRDERDFMKCASVVSSDSVYSRPLIGALLGGGAGALADSIRPTDEDENKVRRKLQAILSGIVFGGIGGLGLNQMKEVSPLLEGFSEPQKPKRLFDPSWTTLAGVGAVGTPGALLLKSRLDKLSPATKAMLKTRIGRALMAGSAIGGAGVVIGNQFRKKAYVIAHKPNPNYRVDGLSKDMIDSIYRGTRSKLVGEADRSSRGSRVITWQGWRDPVTGALRWPVSFGSKAKNDRNASLSPAQANLLSLLTQGRKYRNHRDVARALRKGDSNLEFLGDPTKFDLGASKLTDKGMRDLNFAWKTRFGHDMNEHERGLVEQRLNTLFGTNTIEGGKPFRFERFGPRPI